MNEANLETPLLRARDLTKIYPGIVANDGVDIDLYSGKIHAVIGENGAGKSTLVSTLYGSTIPDRGELYWNGQALEAGHRQKFQALGIGFVPQHVTLCQTFTVWENFVLCDARKAASNPATGGDLRKRAESLNNEYELGLDFNALVSDLALGKRQNIEFLKALLSSPKLLILDEPTAILTPGEVERLFELLKQLRRKGTAIALIAHKLAEVLSLSDEITVLRKGKRVAHLQRSETDANHLASLMVGDQIVDTSSKDQGTPLETINAKETRPTVWLDEVEVESIKNQPKLLEDLSFKVYPGQILGVAGIDGNGQRELFDLLTGDLSPSSGMFEILGNDDLSALPLSERNALGIKRVSEDRQHDGLALELPILDNLILQYAQQKPLSEKGWIKKSHWREIAKKSQERFSIAAASLKAPAASLSGGNQQKVVLARELRDKAKFLVVSQPTRGLDYKAAQFVASQLREAAKSGAAIVLISGDLEELLDLSLNIGVLHRGKWMGIVPNDTEARKRIGRLMAGNREDAA
ncbi:MAG: ATP-binding cassette domain-containing protein [Verrucomicrobiota bacterium]